MVLDWVDFRRLGQPLASAHRHTDPWMNLWVKCDMQPVKWRDPNTHCPGQKPIETQGREKKQEKKRSSPSMCWWTFAVNVGVSSHRAVISSGEIGKRPRHWLEKGESDKDTRLWILAQGLHRSSVRPSLAETFPRSDRWGALPALRPTPVGSGTLNGPERNARWLAERL